MLSEATPEQRPDVILGMVQEAVAKALGFSLPGDKEVNGPLQDIEIDSLAAVLIRNQLAKPIRPASDRQICIPAPQSQSAQPVSALRARGGRVGLFVQQRYS